MSETKGGERTPDGETVGKVGGRRAYTGKMVNLDVDQVRFPNGKIGEMELFRHPGASAVVPFLGDPDGEDPQILLLRQYRYAADGYLYEVPAGKLDGDEDPLVCARRELREETGCTAERVEKLTTIYPTPGFCDERIHLFMATGLTRGETSHEEDEFMDVQVFPMSRVLGMIESGEIQDGKTVCAVLFAAGFRGGA